MLTFVSYGVQVWSSSIGRFGSAKFIALEGDTIAAMVENLKKRIPEKASIVAHDVAGLVALTLASESPQHVRSVTAVSSISAAPTGDSAVDLTLAYPPKASPRERARWALERLSYSHHHIDDALLDDWTAAEARMRPADLMPAKMKFYEACRERGFPVPAQIVWGANDPRGTLELGIWLYRLVAGKQKAAHFHAINRAGALPFREEPVAFHQIVSAFVESV
jgi:pimeloyl-ACP methyl ester carboxylesterase